MSDDNWVGVGTWADEKIAEDDKRELERYQTWPERMARTIWDAFKLPGDVYAGRTDPGSEEAVERSFELASSVIFGPMPIARKVIDGTLGSIAGVGAKANLGRGIRQMKAEMMETKGAGREEIWKETGWYKGSDNKWRTELDSSNARFFDDVYHNRDQVFKVNDGDIRTLERTMDYPELFRAYPELRKMKIKFDNQMSNLGEYRPSHTPGEDMIAINMKMLGDYKYNPTRLMLHEIQHKIQNIEGFHPGRGGPEDQFNRVAIEIGDKWNKAKTWEERSELNQLYIDLSKKKDDFGWWLYRRDPAELEANITEVRRTWSLLDRSHETPIGTMERAKWPKEFLFPNETK